MLIDAIYRYSKSICTGIATNIIQYPVHPNASVWFNFSYNSSTDQTGVGLTDHDGSIDDNSSRNDWIRFMKLKIYSWTSWVVFVMRYRRSTKSSDLIMMMQATVKDQRQRLRIIGATISVSENDYTNLWNSLDLNIQQMIISLVALIIILNQIKYAKW